MLSKTIVFRISNNLKEDLERIRQAISKELGVDIKIITYRHAESVLRLKANRGKVFVKEMQDILLGKIE